jgi:hypothetical protein
MACNCGRRRVITQQAVPGGITVEQKAQGLVADGNVREIDMTTQNVTDPATGTVQQSK